MPCLPPTRAAEVQAAQVAARPQRPSSDCTQPADLTARYVRLLASPLGWLVCLAWLGATVVGALSFGTVLAELRTEFLPLKGSTAEAAVSAYSAAFPHNKTADTLAVRPRRRAGRRARVLRVQAGLSSRLPFGALSPSGPLER